MPLQVKRRRAKCQAHAFQSVYKIRAPEKPKRSYIFPVLPYKSPIRNLYEIRMRFLGAIILLCEEPKRAAVQSAFLCMYTKLKNFLSKKSIFEKISVHYKVKNKKFRRKDE